MSINYKHINTKIKFQDEDGLTVLHCAAGEGHGTIVSTLLASAPWLANEQTRFKLA